MPSLNCTAPTTSFADGNGDTLYIYIVWNPTLRNEIYRRLLLLMESVIAHRYRWIFVT